MMRLSQNLWYSVNPGYYVRDEQDLCSTAKADFTWDPEEVKAHITPCRHNISKTCHQGNLQYHCPCDKAAESL
jgi:hypothetical protein